MDYEEILKLAADPNTPPGILDELVEKYPGWVKFFDLNRNCEYVANVHAYISSNPNIAVKSMKKLLKGEGSTK